MKLAIVVGHNSVSQGAVRQDSGETEYVWNSGLAKMMLPFLQSLGIDGKIFYRTPGGGYTREINRVYDEVDAYNPDASIELHFNSAESPAATGTETLTSGTALSMALAQAVNDEMVRATGLKDRGIKTRSSGRGSASLISGRAPAILIEPFFGSSVKGQQATDTQAEKQRLAEAICWGVYAAFESFPRSDLEDSRTLKAAMQQRQAQTTVTAATSIGAFATVAEMAKEQLEMLPAIGPLSEYIPYLIAGCVVVVFAANMYQRVRTQQIEEARVDDFEKQRR